MTRSLPPPPPPPRCIRRKRRSNRRGYKGVEEVGGPQRCTTVIALPRRHYRRRRRRLPLSQVKMLNRVATFRDDGTVVVDVPRGLDLAPIDVGGEDSYADVTIEESLVGADIPYRPPMQIFILIVGTREDVQPFVAISKCLQDERLLARSRIKAPRKF